MTHKIWTKTNNPFFYFFFTGQKWPMTQCLKCHWDQPVSSENMSYTWAAHARSAFTEEEACEGVDPPPPQPKWASEVINRCEMTPKHTQKWAKASHERVWDPAVVITALQTADQAAQAANYSNYDSLLAEINLIKRRLRSSLTFIRIIIDTRHTPAHTPTCTVRGGGGWGILPRSQHESSWWGRFYEDHHHQITVFSCRFPEFYRFTKMSKGSVPFWPRRSSKWVQTEGKTYLLILDPFCAPKLGA